MDSANEVKDNAIATDKDTPIEISFTKEFLINDGNNQTILSYCLMLDAWQTLWLHLVTHEMPLELA